MKVSWTNGLSAEQANDIKSSFIGGALLRRRLKDLIDNKVESSRGSARSKYTYETPNWAYIQADQVGYERALYEIIDLIGE